MPETVLKALYLRDITMKMTGFLLSFRLHTNAVSRQYTRKNVKSFHTVIRTMKKISDIMMIKWLEKEILYRKSGGKAFLKR